MASRKASIAVAVLWLAAFASSLPAGAQKTGGIAVDVASVDASGFPAVSAVVNVLDDKGRPVSGLTVDAFSATVDGQPATIQGLQSVVDSQVSLSVVLAVDASGSMAGEPLSAAQSAAAEFVNGLSPQDSVAVLAFADAVTPVQEPTSDKAVAIAALQGLTAVGDTALFEATSRAVAKALESSSPRRVIILLSDGVDYGGKSAVSRDDSIAQARMAGVPLYTIALGTEVDKDYLSELAQATAARFLEAPDPESLSQLYGDIGAVLRGQYVVTLQSPAVDPASPHNLELTVNVGGVTAVATRSLGAISNGQPAQVAIQGITAGQSLGSAVTVTAAVSGIVPAEVAFIVDGTLVATSAAAPYQATIDPAALEGDNHTLRVEARDASGATASSEAAFTTASGAGGGTGKTPILLALLAATVGIGGVYVLRRRRPSVRKVVEVRLRPWSNNNAAPGSISFFEDGPISEPEPERHEESGGKVILVNGPHAGKEFDVGMSPISIGTAAWCDIVLPDDDETIGPEEARAWVHEDKLIFHRLTRLSLLASEGVVGGWLILENGDEVDVGRFRLRFLSLVPVVAEQDSVNRAVNEAARRFSPRPSNLGLASRLWPMDPPRVERREVEEETAAPVTSEQEPADRPPADEPTPQHDDVDAGSSKFWPAGSPPTDAPEDGEPAGTTSSEEETFEEPSGEEPDLPRVAEAGSSRFWPAGSPPVEPAEQREPAVPIVSNEETFEEPSEEEPGPPRAPDGGSSRFWPVSNVSLEPLSQGEPVQSPEPQQKEFEGEDPDEPEPPVRAADAGSSRFWTGTNPALQSLQGREDAQASQSNAEEPAGRPTDEDEARPQAFDQGSSRFWPAGSLSPIRPEQEPVGRADWQEEREQPDFSAGEEQGQAVDSAGLGAPANVVPIDVHPVSLPVQPDTDDEGTEDTVETPPEQLARPRLWPVDGAPPEAVDENAPVDEEVPDLWPADQEPLDEDQEPPATASSL